MRQPRRRGMVGGCFPFFCSLRGLKRPERLPANHLAGKRQPRKKVLICLKKVTVGKKAVILNTNKSQGVYPVNSVPRNIYIGCVPVLCPYQMFTTYLCLVEHDKGTPFWAIFLPKNIVKQQLLYMYTSKKYLRQQYSLIKRQINKTLSEHK